MTAPLNATEKSSAPRRRYESVAEFVVKQISTGTLHVGSRVPSLRSISTSQRVSVTTALAAYRLLESRGILEARSQSGFYVRDQAAALLPMPSTAKGSVQARKVPMGFDVSPLLELANDPKLIPFGCAIPSPRLLASSQLDRFLARAARTRGNELNVYSSLHGDDLLRQSIAHRAMRIGHQQAAQHVIITAGCTEALHIALSVTCQRGDTVAVESPCYFGLLTIFEQLGLKVIEIPTHAANGIDTEFLQRVVNRKKLGACVLSASFHNPLGCVTSDAAKHEILEILNAVDVPVIEDDLYGDIYFHGVRPRPFNAFENGGNVIYCSSFSKTIAPGYRLGWVCGSRLTQAMLKQRCAITLCPPTLTQAAMADFLQTGAYDNHLRKLRRTFAGNLSRARQVIGETFPASTRVSRPSGGFSLWLELDPIIDTRQLFERALEYDICFAPGQLFSATGKYGNCMRLSCGHEWSPKIERALVKLGELVADMRKR